MILTADSTVAHATSRRKTANGWHTTFIGKNRNTLKENEAAPSAEGLYPMAFLVEKEAAAVVHPHFHQADQYQVVVQGSGRLGVHDIASVAVHYTDAYSAYGPIIAADEGVSWFTLRNAWDPGARYMPAQRQQLREARAKFQHREATCGPLPPLTDARTRRADRLHRRRGDRRDRRRPRHLALHRPRQRLDHRARPVHRRRPVLAGLRPVRRRSPAAPCCRCSPASSWPRRTQPARLFAGPGGADLICMQFPKRARD